MFRNMALLRLSDATMMQLDGHGQGEAQIWRSTLRTTFGEQQRVYHELAAELGQDLFNGIAPPRTSMGERLPSDAVSNRCSTHPGTVYSASSHLGSAKTSRTSSRSAR